MRNLGRVFIAIVLSLGFVYAASVEATVNTKEVVKGNPIQLRIKAIGGSAAFPNIRDINGAMVSSSGTSRQSSMQISVNGMKNEVSTVRKYIFVPEHDMVIPSYTVRIGGDNYKTKPIQIKVTTSQAPSIDKNAKFSFVLKSEKNTVSVGESFVVTLYFSLADRVQGIQLSNYGAPTASEFFIKEIEGQKEYAHNGYTVIEKQYIVTAQKEGNITISPATARLGQPDWSKQDIFGRPGISWMPINSNALDIEVKPLVTDTDLVGDFTLDTKLDAQSVKSNKPVNLTVKIQGEGSLEDFVFPKYEIAGVTVYSDEAKVESHIDNTTLLSSFSKNFAFIAEDDFVIPERNITAYNPKTKETITLKVPRYEVSIKGEKVVASPVVSATIATTPVSKIVEKEVIVKSTNWWVSLLTFVLGMLVMYLLRFIPKLLGAKERPYKESKALKILYAHISEGADVEEMVRKLYAKKSGDKIVQIDKKELREMVDRFI